MNQVGEFILGFICLIIVLIVSLAASIYIYNSPFGCALKEKITKEHERSHDEIVREELAVMIARLEIMTDKITRISLRDSIKWDIDMAKIGDRYREIFNKRYERGLKGEKTNKEWVDRCALEKWR